MPELRQYQLEDVDFLKDLSAAACFNQQRTGKTPTALKLIKAKGLQKVLIVTPSSAIYQWKEEYERWLDRPCIALVGNATKRTKMLEAWTDGLVISYDTFKVSRNTPGMVREILALQPEMLILDEAHRIKSRNAARTDAIMTCSKIPQKLLLTATPAPGKPEEIFTLLHFLYPERFPSYWRFIEEFFQKGTGFAPGGRRFIQICGFKHGKDVVLQEFLATISTQRKRHEVMPWLPSKDYTQIKLPPTPEQERYLHELSEFYETEHIVTQGTLDRLIRYRQICLDPGLLELKGKSPKTDWILQYLTDYPEESIIIFSKFTSYLKKLEPLIAEKTTCELMIGSTPVAQRNCVKLNFQDKKFRVLLLNVDVGKEALTLDRADTIIFTDKYPPIGDIEQAEDRFVATTQDRADKPHKIYELMIKGTYDENLYTLLKKRKSETDILNDYKHFIQERSKKTCHK